MLIVEESTLVEAPLELVRQVVLDPRAYSQADTKVDSIELQQRTEHGMIARIYGRLGPFKSSILAEYTVRERRIDLDMIEGRLRGFHAAFEMEPADGHVRLTHREEYDFGYPVITPLVELALRGWARRSIEAEIASLKRAAERALTERPQPEA